MHVGHPSDIVPEDRDDDDFMACFQGIAGSYEKTDAPITGAQKDMTVESAREVERCTSSFHCGDETNVLCSTGSLRRNSRC